MHGFGFGPSRRRGRPSLWTHDFSAGALPNGAAFTRSGSARHDDGSGLVATVGTDVPRYQHAWTGAAYARQGLLMEQQGTNNVPSSEDFSAFTAANSTVTVNATTAPDGTSTADKIVAAATNSVHNRSVALSIGAGAMTDTVYLKAAEYGFATLTIVSDFSTKFFGATINLATGAMESTSSNGSPVSAAVGTPVRLANGWWRVSVTATSASGSIYLYVSPSPSGTPTYTAQSVPTYLGDGTSGIHAWGAGMSVRAWPGSYIPTTGSAATRAADSLKGTLATIIPLFSAAAGTVWLESEALLPSPTSDTTERTLLSMYKAADATGERMRCYAKSGNVYWDITAGTVLQASIAVARTQAFKAAMRYAANNAQLCVGGTLGTPDTTLTLPSGLDTLALGCGASAGSELAGILKRVGYAPSAYSDAALQGLTA